jgi:effector-binding domain-containing protein
MFEYRYFFSVFNINYIHCVVHRVENFLEANGSVQNGSTVYYDSTKAKLELQLKMLIHKFSNQVHESHQQKGIKYRIELDLVDGSRETMNDYEFSACHLAFLKFTGSCKEHHIFTPIYQHLSHDYMVIVCSSFI